MVRRLVVVLAAVATIGGGVTAWVLVRAPEKSELMYIYASPPLSSGAAPRTNESTSMFTIEEPWTLSWSTRVTGGRCDASYNLLRIGREGSEQIDQFSGDALGEREYDDQGEFVVSITYRCESGATASTEIQARR